MKKIFLILITGLIFQVYNAQDFFETSYKEGEKEADGFMFKTSVCDSNILIEQWKEFIKTNGGKTKGGIINKTKGENLKFSSDGKLWQGNFAYAYNDADKDYTILLSFMDSSGNYLTVKSEAKETSYLMPALYKFKYNIEKNCISNELESAKNYLSSLKKEQNTNSSKLIKINDLVRSTTAKISELESSSNNEKSQKKIEALKAKLEIQQAEIKMYTQRNFNLNSEIPAQQKVVENFESQLGALKKP